MVASEPIEPEPEYAGKKRSQIISDSDDFLNHADDIIEKASINNNRVKEVVVATLFAKIIDDAHAIRLLCDQGWTIQGEIIVRSSLETLFYMGACDRDDEALKNYLGKHTLEKRRNINIAKNEPEYFDQATRREVLSWEEEVTREINERKLKRLSAKTAADIAGVTDLYLAYSLHSDAGHSNPYYLQEKYMSFDNDLPCQINYGQNPVQYENVLLSSNVILALACKWYRKIFAIECDPHIEQITLPYLKENA